MYQTNPPTEGYWKFVCVNGEYRFIDGTDFYASHAEAVKEGEKATSAGSIFVHKDHWREGEVSSMTLKIGMVQADYTAITGLLGKPYKPRY